MLRSNSKKAKENIRQYIRDGFTGENYGIEEPQKFEELARIIMETFREEKLNPEREYNRRRGYSDQRVFEDWCQGLPSIIDTLYYYNRSAVEDLARLLEETPEEAAKYSEQDAERMITYLIFRELSAAERKARTA